MLRLKSSLATTLSVAALTIGAPAAMAQDRPGEGVSYIMAQPSWDTGWFHTEIVKQLMAELGFSAGATMTLDNPAFYQSVAYGDVTMWVDGWFPGHDIYRPVFEGQAETIGAVAKGGALEGYLVDKASADKFDIKTLDDFKRPEVQEAFDRNGDGKADMVACPPGWACETNIEHHMTAYGLLDHVNPIKAGYAAAMADAIASYQAGESIFFYTWTPNWTIDELKPGEDVVWIEVPRIDLPENLMPLADNATQPDIEGCVANPCMLGFPANDIVSVANTEFLDANPSARALLETVEIPLADMSSQNAKMNAGDRNIEEHAAAWIEANRDLVDGWMEQARAAATQ